MRDVKITAVMNGFLVRVDCQTLVFQSRDELIRELDAYLRDPDATEKQFIARHGLRGGQDVAAVPTPAYENRSAPADWRLGQTAEATRPMDPRNLAPQERV